MTRDEFLERVAGVTVWRRAGERAPHKPLLLLWALGRFEQGVAAHRFSEAEGPLRALLGDFGPPRVVLHPEYPFWRLASDGLWELAGAGAVRRTSGGDPTLTSMRLADPVGRFPDAVAHFLTAEPALITAAAERVLESHFPATLHEAIRVAVGLAGPARSGKRDPRFRKRVLRAYGYRCAVCGFEARLDARLIGLDAAHVRWRQAGGRDTVENGLALCTLHHRLLDEGAYTLTSDRRVQLSQAAHGGAGFDDWLLRYHRRPVRAPARGPVAEEHLRWHRRQVFKEPPRPLPA